MENNILNVLLEAFNKGKISFDQKGFATMINIEKKTENFSAASFFERKKNNERL